MKGGKPWRDVPIEDARVDEIMLATGMTRQEANLLLGLAMRRAKRWREDIEAPR